MTTSDRISVSKCSCLQVEIRDRGKQANDLFFQILIKGTSHLSLRPETLAAGVWARSVRLVQ